MKYKKRNIQCGTDITGTVALGNIQYGVYLLNGPTNNTIGGTNPSERNIVSGNGWKWRDRSHDRSLLRHDIR